MKTEEKFPVEFAERMEHRLESESESFFRALNDEPVVSVRYNTLKHSLAVDLDPVPWCRTGYYLDKRPVFTFDPALHAGCYYVQEASSMFLEQAIVQLNLHKRKILALDLCASPGGKTTHLASLLHEESFLVSNETIHTRIPALRENVIKWGSGNILVTQNEPADFSAMQSLFDLVVVDAPCSGEGLFRKDRDSINQWSPQNCDGCATRQRRILREAIPCLRPGGVLVYSTCTFNEKENEEQVKWLNEESGLISQRLDVSEFDGAQEIAENNGYSYAFYPHKLRGEGFFLAAFRKEGMDQDRVSFHSRKSIFQHVPSSFSHLSQWLKAGSGFRLYKKGDFIFALPQGWMEEIEFFFETLNVKYPCSVVAELKGSKAIPQHALAMSTLLNKNHFQSLEITDEQAMAFLRKESFTISAVQKGWMLVAWKGVVLGWVNHLGNRTNNYYPVEWRIRKS